MDDWRAAIDERIRTHRTAPLSIRLTDASGQPLANRPVALVSTRPPLQIGSCVASSWVQGSDANSERYRRFLSDHCAILVDENHAKWYSTEKTPGTVDWSGADAIAAFAQAQDIPLRGHCLYWDREKWVHDWVRERRGDALRQAVLDRCRDAVTHMRGKVSCWDVFNEILDGGWFEAQLPGIHVEIFELAHELDPDASLFVNEFGILGGGEKTDRYLALIDRLRQGGAPVGGIGIQEHACERLGPAYDAATTATPKEIERLHNVQLSCAAFWQDCDRLADTGLPLHLTEVSCKNPDPLVRATGLEALLGCAMAHPAVEAVLLWGFWAPAHWLGSEACLFAADWTCNAAGERVLELLTNTWRTKVSGTTAADGRFSWHGFTAPYRCTIADRHHELDFSVERDATLAV